MLVRGGALPYPVGKVMLFDGGTMELFDDKVSVTSGNGC